MQGWCTSDEILADAPEPLKEKLSASLEATMHSHQFSLLVTDTDASDLTIADPARFMAIAEIFYGGVEQKKVRAEGIVQQYFRDILAPVTALPGTANQEDQGAGIRDDVSRLLHNHGFGYGRFAVCTRRRSECEKRTGLVFYYLFRSFLRRPLIGGFDYQLIGRVTLPSSPMIFQ